MLKEKPNSAEAEHYLGRVFLSRDNVSESLTHFNRAWQLDSTQAEFVLYRGWALLELGEEIGDLTQEQAALLDEKRRLETERAYLRHPNRIRTFAEERLDMHPADPQRIQSIELLVKTEELPAVPEDEPADGAEPQVPQGVQP